MSRRISALLEQPEQTVVSLLNKLEEKNGYPSHDSRFLAENIQKIRAKISDLGLDPDDTTGEELHHALMIKFEVDAKKFDEAFNALNLDFQSRLKKSAEIINSSVELPQRWVLKNSVAKALLRKQPPKKVMKLLGYRSSDSMLKRESTASLFLGAQVLESQTWHSKLNKLISKLNQTDFEPKKMNIHIFTSQKWLKAPDPPTYVTLDSSIGAVAVWPSNELENASLLCLSLLLLEELDKFGHVEPTKALVKSGGLVMWWLDMDHLVANLNGEHVSLSVKDCVLNSLENTYYGKRSLIHGQTGFWKELLNRYDKLPEADGLFDDSIREKVARLKFAPPQPAYEFVEDI